MNADCHRLRVRSVSDLFDSSSTQCLADGRLLIDFSDIRQNQLVAHERFELRERS